MKDYFGIALEYAGAVVAGEIIACSTFRGRTAGFVAVAAVSTCSAGSAIV